MLTLLRERVEANPDHADSWRLLGRVLRQRGQLQQASDALQRALRADPDHAASHFDYGELLFQQGEEQAASEHFQKVLALAPGSSYAAQLRQRGVEAATPSGKDADAAVQPASYEIQTFDGADDLDRRMNQLESQADPDLKRLRVYLETGVLYNSNVSLTPISRELADSEAASFQGFLNPEVEWLGWDRDGYRGGPLMRGYFSLNEGNWSAFNLASFQPGAFLERDFLWNDREMIGRLEYLYALDLFDGERVGDRHSMTASLTTIRPDLDVIYAYVTTSFSQFDDDGLNPAVTSLDGSTWSTGISRFFQTESSRFPTWSLGLDLESADTEGANFRYTAVNAHGDVTMALSERVEFIPRWGVGYRPYSDFTGEIDRDELTWRVAARLRWQLRDYLSISAVAGHDRFASDNPDFDTERTEGGVVTTILY